MWQQHEAKDGTYTFKDLLIAHEILDVKETNDRAFADWKANQEDD
jgi:hypothetical protein